MQSLSLQPNSLHNALEETPAGTNRCHVERVAQYHETTFECGNCLVHVQMRKQLCGLCYDVEVKARNMSADGRRITVTRHLRMSIPLTISGRVTCLVSEIGNDTDTARNIFIPVICELKRLCFISDILEDDCTVHNNERIPSLPTKNSYL